MWCHCTKPDGWQALVEEDGSRNNEVWVCGRCKKASRLVFEKVTGMYAPKGATAWLSLKGHANGIQEIRWAMADGSRKTTIVYHPYPQKVGMEVGRSLLLDTWKLLDSKVDIIMAEPNDPHGDNSVEAEARTRAKYEARGIAEVLANFMSPFFSSADDIVREAVARYKARTSGSDHETPGLAEEIWSPNRRWDGTVYDEKKSAKSGFKSIDKKTMEGIKLAISAGILDEKGAAELYKVSLEQVRAVVSG